MRETRDRTRSIDRRHTQALFFSLLTNISLNRHSTTYDVDLISANRSIHTWTMDVVAKMCSISCMYQKVKYGLSKKHIFTFPMAVCNVNVSRAPVINCCVKQVSAFHWTIGFYGFYHFHHELLTPRGGLRCKIVPVILCNVQLTFHALV